MAERRMFAKTIIDSDAFLDMSLSTQALYFHLSMRADDDGFVNNPKKVQRMIGCGDDELKMLVAKKFIIPFESGVCVIKHWRIHNYIRNDRYKETVYQDEKLQLSTKENGAYTLQATVGIPLVNQMDTVGIPSGYILETQDRLGKDRLGKDRLDEDSRKKEKRKSEFDLLIENYTNDLELRNTIYEFIKMRKAIKAAMTSNALRLMLRKLDKLSNCDNNKKLKILEQSIMNSWKGIFELKREDKQKNLQYSNKPKLKFDNFKGRDYDYDDLEKRLLGWDDEADEERENPSLI